MVATDAPAPPQHWPKDVMLFTVAYLVPAIAAAVWTRNGEFVFYSAVMLVLIAAVSVAHRRSRLSRTVLWGLSLWGLAHMVGGLIPVPESWPTNGPNKVVYSWWLIPGFLKYDQIVHVFGFYVTTLVCWQGLYAIVRDIRADRSLQPTFGVLLLCAAAAQGFGALNEVIEFVATLLVPNTNVGGYVNTGWDLVSNLIGTVLAAVWLRFFSSRTSAA